MEQEEDLFRVKKSASVKVELLFTLGEGQKRRFGKTTWSKEGLKYFRKVETTWQEKYADEAQMNALVNGWERWVPDEDLN